MNINRFSSIINEFNRKILNNKAKDFTLDEVASLGKALILQKERILEKSVGSSRNKMEFVCEGKKYIENKTRQYHLTIPPLKISVDDMIELGKELILSNRQKEDRQKDEILSVDEKIQYAVQAKRYILFKTKQYDLMKIPEMEIPVKSATSQHILSWMESILDLSLIPEQSIQIMPKNLSGPVKEQPKKEIELLYEKKRKFLENSLNPEANLHSLNWLYTNYALHIPFLDKCLQHLKESYAELTENSIELQEKIKKQQQNIINLIRLLSTLQRQDNLPYLVQQKPIDEDSLAFWISKKTELSKEKHEILKSKVNAWISGEEVLSKKDLRAIKSHFELLLNNIEIGDEEERKSLKTFPVILSSLQKQAALYEAENQGKRWASNKSTLNPLGTTDHEVFPLGKRPIPVAFYKQDAGEGDNAGAMMEKKVWDMAVILGMDKRFAATKLTQIRSKEDLIPNFPENYTYKWLDIAMRS
jgi:hypothetical protein